MKNNFKVILSISIPNKGISLIIFKGSIIILNEKGGMCNFSNLRELSEIVRNLRGGF